MTETGYPCYRCGVNAWTSCKHREAEQAEPLQVRAPQKPGPKNRIGGGGCYSVKPAIGNGRNFRIKRASK